MQEIATVLQDAASLHGHVPGDLLHIIAPVPVLARHANDQLLHVALDPRSTRAMTNLRAIEFAGDQLAVTAT